MFIVISKLVLYIINIVCAIPIGFNHDRDLYEGLLLFLNTIYNVLLFSVYNKI